MVSGKPKTNTNFPGEGTSFAGCRPARILFKSACQDANFPRFVTPHTPIQERNICYRKLQKAYRNAQEGPFLAILGPHPRTHAHTDLPSFFTLDVNSCKRRLNHATESSSYEGSEGTGPEALGVFKRTKRHSSNHPLRRQARRSHLANLPNDSNDASFRCVSGPMATSLDQIRIAQPRTMAKNLGTLLIGGHS